MDEGNGVLGRRGVQDIVQGNIFEAVILADGVVVWDVDPGGNTKAEVLDLQPKDVIGIPGASEGEDFKGGEVWSRKLVFLEVGGPRELEDHGWGSFDKLTKLNEFQCRYPIQCRRLTALVLSLFTIATAKLVQSLIFDTVRSVTYQDLPTPIEHQPDRGMTR